MNIYLYIHLNQRNNLIQFFYIEDTILGLFFNFNFHFDLKYIQEKHLTNSQNLWQF